MRIYVDGLGKKNQYDERGLVYSKSKRNLYPSKKMFVDFLKKYNDIKADVSIYGIENWSDGEVTINVELKYKVKDYKRPIKEIVFACDICCNTKTYEPLRHNGNSVCRVCYKNRNKWENSITG